MHDKEFDSLREQESKAWSELRRSADEVRAIFSRLEDTRNVWNDRASRLSVAIKNRTEDPQFDVTALRAVPRGGEPGVGTVHAHEMGPLACDSCGGQLSVIGLLPTVPGLFWCDRQRCQRFHVRLRRKPVEMEIVQGQVGAGQLEKAKA